jgi:hypothetical protein
LSIVNKKINLLARPFDPPINAPSSNPPTPYAFWN